MELSKRHNPALRMEKILTELGHIADSFWVFLGFLLLVILNFLAPVKFSLTLIAYLIFADVITALIALFMEKKRASCTLACAFKDFYNSWTSRRAFDSAPKFLFYCLLIIAGFLVGKFFNNSDQYAKVATAIVCYVELRSIIENGDKAFGTNMWELLADYAKKLLPGKK